MTLESILRDTSPGESDSIAAAILIVDDQPDNIHAVGEVLGRLGYNIIPAGDGPTALKRLAAHPPDLVLLDVLMPGMDGCEVCNRMRENPAWCDIPVIFLSAADDKDLVVRAMELGGVDYITKPFNPAELVSRVRTQLALKSAHDRLKQLAEDKDELLGILTHDLKARLDGMQLNARRLRDWIAPTADDRSMQLAENIYHSGDQLLTFVKEFLANTATDSGIAVKPTTLSLSEAAAVAVERCQGAAQRKRLKIQASLPGEGTAVLADPSALDQVLDNLLSNAVKFSPAGKRVLVTVQSRSSHVECRIQDEGPGFTAEDRGRMFRRYARLSAQPTGGEPSTGLGLSIVHKLVEILHGELTCESAPGAGAAFTVRLSRPHAS